MNYVMPLIIEDLKNGISKNDVVYYYDGLPDELGDEGGNRGSIFVSPVSTGIEPVSTGMIDSEQDEIHIVLAKESSTFRYQNPRDEGGMGFMTRVMNGKDVNNQRLTNSIVYIIRNNIRRYGLRNPSFKINWNDNRFEKEGMVTSTLIIRNDNLVDQPII